MTTPGGPAAPPRLTRSRTDRKIAGVAGGIAAYLNLDPVWVRIAFLVLLFTGPGLLLYLICWIAMPEEEPTVGSSPAAPAATTATGGSDSTRLVFGGLLIAAGIYLALAVWLPMTRVAVLPLALIGAGIAVILYGTRR